MLPCFFHGFSCFLVCNSSRSSHILSLVSLGLIISSIKPLAAAWNGVHSVASYSSCRCVCSVGGEGIRGRGGRGERQRERAEWRRGG